MNDKEFYEYIDEKRREIDSSDVSDEERAGLYKVVEETVQRYVELKTVKEINHRSFEIGDCAIAEANEAVLSLQREVERKDSLLGWILSQED